MRGRPELTGGKVGVLGFCLGGKLAYLAATRTDADVAVGYYGVGIEAALGEAAKISKPLLLHIAELDQFCPPEARAKIVQALQGNPHVRLHVYPGVDHAFARVGGDHFHRPSALMAHERTIATLKGRDGPATTTCRRSGTSTANTSSAPATSTTRCRRWWPSPT